MPKIHKTSNDILIRIRTEQVISKIIKRYVVPLKITLAVEKIPSIHLVQFFFNCRVIFFNSSIRFDAAFQFKH